MDAIKLKELGLDKAADKLNAASELKRKLTIAYEHFKVVTEGIIERFQEELMNKTMKIVKRNEWGDDKTYDVLQFVNLKDYGEIPPEECLADLAHAKEFKCFDDFEVAYTREVYEEAKKPDPIIFGRINGSPDRFFITQWDDDVKITDILKDGEG